jgi:omega-hydroxy-beta-dihydromenaquinone-9 sulfotransferase
VLALQDRRSVDVDAAVLATYPTVMRRLREAAASLPPGTFAEVAFDRLASDPLPTLRRLWRDLDLPDWPAATERIGTYLDTIRGYRPTGAGLTDTEAATLRRRWPRELALYGPEAAEPSRLTAARSG